MLQKIGSLAWSRANIFQGQRRVICDDLSLAFARRKTARDVLHRNPGARDNGLAFHDFGIAFDTWMVHGLCPVAFSGSAA